MSLQDPKNPRRHLYSTSTKYEFQFGYSRAVRHGRVVRVAGTAGLTEDGQVISDDVVEQMRRALEIIKAALEDLGSSLGEVIMTRIYVRDVHDIDRIAVIHGEVFREIRPATTIVKVDFIDARILVEIEAEAVYGGATEFPDGKANPKR
ncbi:MAG: RidA family protein [Chloroflexota bacterium]|nr:RidA family protein [Chloroflexota bacterium]